MDLLYKGEKDMTKQEERFKVALSFTIKNKRTPTMLDLRFLGITRNMVASSFGNLGILTSMLKKQVKLKKQVNNLEELMRQVASGL